MERKLDGVLNIIIISYMRTNKYSTVQSPSIKNECYRKRVCRKRKECVSQEKEKDRVSQLNCDGDGEWMVTVSNERDVGDGVHGDVEK